MLVSGLGKSYGARTLFSGVGFQLPPGRRLAVVGPNGAGKTTLLRILAGRLEPDAGEVVLPRGARVALHDQRPPLGRDVSLGDYVAEGARGARETEARLAAIEARMAAGDHGPETLAEYQRAGEAFETAGGYAWRSWMERVLRGLGIDAGALDRPLASFSGGELTRASLARSLVGRPDVLLLDEPTNHLDLDAMVWLEATVTELAATVVLVSHDRWFLESVATDVLEIEAGRAKLWPLGYSAFRRERALAMDRQSAEAERQAREIARLERFVARWSAGTRSRQATSRRRALARIERVEPPTRARSLAFGFPRSETPARVVLELDAVELRAGERVLVRDVGLAVERGQRLAIVAPNGAGKTTLIEAIVGRRAPAAGRVSVGHRVRMGYFSQHAAELDPDRTLAETILAGTDLTATQARTLLGRFHFPGDSADKRVESLSGGERRRLSLVRLIAEGPNVLVLDEPTNHLDVESREALEEALLAFDGTTILVSHDRALIDLVATHTLALEDGRPVLRNGGYRDLVATREAAAAPLPRPAPARAPRARHAPAPVADRPPARGRRELDRLERAIGTLEAEAAELERALAEASGEADGARVAALGERHRAVQAELSWKMRDWEALAERAGV